MLPNRNPVQAKTPAELTQLVNVELARLPAQMRDQHLTNVDDDA